MNFLEHLDWEIEFVAILYLVRDAECDCEDV